MKNIKNKTGIYKYFSYKQIQKTLLVIQVIFIILFGYIVIKNYPIFDQFGTKINIDETQYETFKFEIYALYYFGLAIFMAGFYPALYGKIFGLIYFLICGTFGLEITLGNIISNILKNPIMTDNPTNIIIYLVIAVIFFIIFLVVLVIHNLNVSFRKKKFILNILIFLISIPIIMIMILPLIMDKLLLLSFI